MSQRNYEINAFSQDEYGIAQRTEYMESILRDMRSREYNDAIEAGVGINLYENNKDTLPESEEEEFKALEVAEKLKLQLKKLELIRLLSDQMLKKKRLGKDVFLRGMKGSIRSINSYKYSLSLFEILKTYSTVVMTKDFQKINIPKLPVFTAEDGIKTIREFFGKLIDWKKLDDLIPKNFKSSSKYKRTGKAGIFDGSLE